MNEPWLIQLLGGLSARQGEQRVMRFRTRRAGALLAYLVFFSHQTHPRGELAELFWPEADLEAGRNSLKQALSSLRRQLEPPDAPAGSILIADRQTVRVNPGAVTSDVQQFEAALRAAARAAEGTERAQFLAHAVESYGGPLLPGLEDEWVWPERLRLTEAYERAHRQLAQLRDQVLEPPTPGAPTAHLTSKFLTPSLPISFTRFFNRTEEVTLLRAMLAPPPGFATELPPPEARLVTLTGMGGTGKTRLAIEAARGLAGAFGGAVWFVPLEDIPSADLIVETIRDALRLPRSEASDPMPQVIEALTRQASLLILDNFEHVAEEGAPIVQRLLEQAPALKCLVTSRQILGLAAEYEMVISPLLTPQGPETPECLTRYASVQLFVDRAQRVRPDFQLTTRNSEAVASLCEQLEGFPLALELAAARAAILTPRQMLEQLSRRSEFMVSQRRDLPGRHRSLGAAMEWSYRLLPPQEQALFARLSIFRGGWTLKAAEGVCEGPQVLEGLQLLRDNSLLTTEESHGQIRYRMFETLRTFAEEHLSSERHLLAQRQSAYYLKWSAQTPAHFQDEEQGPWFDCLETEHANLRAALVWLLDNAGEMALALTGRLWPFWELRGHITEGRFWLTQALTASTARTLSRAEALRGAGILSDAQDDFAAALAQTQESVSLFRELSDYQGLAYSLAFFGYLHRETDPARARALLTESLAIFREKEHQAGLIYALCFLGRLAIREGQPVEASVYCMESLAISRRLSDLQGTAESLHLLANAALSQGDLTTAHSLLEECLALYRRLENRKGLAYALFSLGHIDYKWEQDRSAQAMLEESREILLGIGHGPNLILLLQLLETLARRRGDHQAAFAYQKEALALRDRLKG